MKLYQIIKFFKKNNIHKLFLITFLSLIVGSLYYSHKFIPLYSDTFYAAKSAFEKAKKKNTVALSKVKKVAKDSEEYKEYKIVNKDKYEKFLKYKQIMKDEEVFGFKSLHFFWERFIRNTISLTFTIWVLVWVLKIRKKISDLVFWSRILVILAFISAHFYTYFWIFQRFQDLSLFQYFLMSIFSSYLTVQAFFLIYKYRKTTFEKLTDNNRKALAVIKELESEVLIKQEEERVEERQRISQELHDGILGKLFGTRMKLGFLDLSKEQSKEKYQKFLIELQEIEKEIREVTHKLNNNLNGTDIDFITITNQLLEDKKSISNFNYSLEINPDINWKSFNELVKVNLYRVMQEALQNIIKHANAKDIIVKIDNNDDELMVLIEDNGIGFESIENEKGIGIKNIKSRVNSIQGGVKIHSKLNKGTSIEISIPKKKR